MAEQRGFVLPVSIISPTDIARLKREIDGIDNYFAQAQIREGGQQQVAMPRMSKLMDQLAAENKLNMLQNDHRAYVVKTLENLQASAPVLHVSFSVDPPGSYVQKIVYWLRMNVHGQVLVTVGLQPNIGAGCIVRTTNKIFDFSLREYFNEKRDFFIQKMHEAISEESITESTEPSEPLTVSSAQQASAVSNTTASPDVVAAVPATAENVAPVAAVALDQASSTTETAIPVPVTVQGGNETGATKS